MLLLPGALCSGEFYEDVFAEPALASHRLVAATVPGFGRTKAPDDLTIEKALVVLQPGTHMFLVESPAQTAAVIAEAAASLAWT